jgi:epoxyqueuosine reductase QueG
MGLELAHDIRELALRAGADFFGVADLAPAHDAILEQGGESVAQFPRAIAIGIVLSDSIINLLPQQTDARVAQRYQGVYDETNQKLDQIASRVVGRLQTAGATALAVYASQKVDADGFYGSFSHKMAAHLAGLGWIGRSCLLITPEAGPRVRWVTVLTDAPLAATGQASDEKCGTCRLCVDKCPARAFTGKPFRAGERRDIRFAVRDCVNCRKEMEEKMGCPVLCGICVAVCPHGRRRDPQNHFRASKKIREELGKDLDKDKERAK